MCAQDHTLLSPDVRNIQAYFLLPLPSHENLYPFAGGARRHPCAIIRINRPPLPAILGPGDIRVPTQISVWRQLSVDALENFQKLLMPMAPMTLPCPITSPVATSKAANSEVVPWLM